MGNAYISDKRNDENQMVLQVHLLVSCGTHNTLIEGGLAEKEAYLRRRCLTGSRCC